MAYIPHVGLFDLIGQLSFVFCFPNFGWKRDLNFQIHKNRIIATQSHHTEVAI